MPGVPCNSVCISRARSPQYFRTRRSDSTVSCSAARAASCTKPGRPYSMQISRFSAWSINIFGPIIQPTRQPHIAWVLERLPMVTTRSGNASARLGTRPSGASPAYTSSTTTQRSCRRAISPMRASSSAVKMMPLGLPGVAKNRARERGLMADSRSAMSGLKRFAARSGTRTRRAPDASSVAGEVG